MSAAEDAAFWDVVAALAPGRLPSSLSRAPAREPRELSLALRNARLAASRLPPSERALLTSLLLRPTDPGGPFGYTVPEAPPHCTTNFCIHYVTSTSDAPPVGDLDQSGVLDVVEETAEKLELAREALITFGYSYHGIDDDGLGGDERLDVYIKDVGFEFTAAVVPEDIKEFSPIRLSSYMLINTYAYTLPPEYFDGVVAHELKHTFDAATFGNAPAWLFESSAVWIENEVNDADTAHTMFFPCWYTWPEFSTDVPRDTPYPPDLKDPGNCAGAPYHIYGSATLWFHLGAELGANVNREVWDQGGLACVGANEPDSAETRSCVADVIAKIASDAGADLEQLFLEFSVNNYRPRKSPVLLQVESGGELFAWPDSPHIEKDHTTYPAGGDGTLDHWSSRYYEFSPLTTGGRPLTVSVDGPDGAAFGATLVVSQSDAITEVPIELDPSTNQGEASVEYFGGSVKKVALVVTNPAAIETNDSSDGLAFSYTASLGDAGTGGSSGSGGAAGSGAAGGAGAAGAAGSPATPDESGDDGGCGCRTTSSGSGASLVPLGALGLLALRRRRRRR
jgi:MYXO-CTERM domain-containing protein